MTPTPIRQRPLPADSLEARSTLLGRDEVCRRLGISSWTLGAWTRSGRFPRPCVRATPSTYRWRLSVLLQWVEDKAREPHRAPKLRGQAKRWHAPRRIIVRERL
jgi:predicted DNA-binding transcriptional regulator AlpA